MVAVHRRQVIEVVRLRLDPEHPAPCRLIATSLVEAGIDLDFPRVWRAKAGLDSIMQAAGRCNREGRRSRDDSIVTIFTPEQNEPPREIKAFAEAMERVSARHTDLAALDTITEYFQEVYWQKGPEALDRNKVMEQFKACATETNFAFRTVAEAFRLIDEGMAPVIVPRDATSKRAVAELASAEKTAGIARRLQPYLVQIPPRDREALIRFGQVRFADPARQFAVLEDAALYDPDFGLLWEEAGQLRTGII
jgi:CRISPR-associated endonuclease/helicase Cas3